MVAAPLEPSPAPPANAAPRRLRCCDASGCRRAGGPALRQALEAARAEPGRDGESAAIEIRRVGCLRLCGRGPLVAEDGPDGSQLYGALPEEQARTLVRHAEAPALEPWRLSLNQPFFALQRPVVLETCGLVDPESIDDALALGTYATLRRCLEQLTPEQVREQVRRSGLRGRGGAGYPTGLKWDTVALQPPGPRWVVCNADEGDPGAFMDRSVLEGDPHRLIEGLAIAAYAVGAHQGFVYLRAEYPLAVERLRRALDQARERGWLGPAIGGSRFGLELELRVGAGAYVCGEETALLASIQGQRGTPRPRPPYPAQHGLWNAPTLINNVETLAAVPAILREGGDWYAAMGTEHSGGTKVFSLSGDVLHTGLVEVPIGTPLRTVVDTMGGGTATGRPLKAVQTGGPAGGCIPASLLDTPADYESLKALGSMMGSGGMVVLGEGTAMPNLAHYFMGFCVQESCGRCLPCRAGTVQLEQLLQRFAECRANPDDLRQLEELCQMVAATSLCGLGQAAPNPVLSTLRWFRHEYEAACSR
ncbi:MAG: NADH-ubiquinone oxidoreductase-F iron-sulfur binding region domain-containing protein [Synechococcaceae cyanobacterium]|nr:NADH-ubiquinone oxidoreductase-F iron-sulfur binding region domain-containing protein [Synechococcaceae cyanobacterium]